MAELANLEFTHDEARALPVIEENGRRVPLVADEAFGAASPIRTESASLYVDMQFPANTKILVADEYVEQASCH